MGEVGDQAGHATSVHTMGFISAFEVLTLYPHNNEKLLNAQKVYARSLHTAVPGKGCQIGNKHEKVG